MIKRKQGSIRTEEPFPAEGVWGACLLWMCTLLTGGGRVLCTDNTALLWCLPPVLDGDFAVLFLGTYTTSWQMLWMCLSAGNKLAFSLVTSLGCRRRVKLPHFPFWKRWNFMWFSELRAFTEFLLPEVQQNIL